MKSFTSNHQWESKIVDDPFFVQRLEKNLKLKNHCSKLYELSREKAANERDMRLALLNEDETRILRKGIVSNTTSFNTDQTLHEVFWTREKLIDMTFQRIAIIKCVVRDPSGKEIQFPKYLLQADYLAPRFAIFNPPPVFKLNPTDLGPEIIQKLFMLDGNTRGKVILEAVSRIFRKLFPFYSNQGIAEFFQVEVVE